MKIFVWVTIYTHKYGNDINVFETEEQAEEHRQEIAREYWDDTLIDEPMPSDPQEAADAYFEHVTEFGEEYFECSQQEIIRAG